MEDDSEDPDRKGTARSPAAGAMRLSCVYCARMKRKCSGGDPCELCIRRSKDCTRSARRKSGPMKGAKYAPRRNKRAANGTHQQKQRQQIRQQHDYEDDSDDEEGEGEQDEAEADEEGKAQEPSAIAENGRGKKSGKEGQSTQQDGDHGIDVSDRARTIKKRRPAAPAAGWAAAVVVGGGGGHRNDRINGSTSSTANGAGKKESSKSARGVELSSHGQSREGPKGNSNTTSGEVTAVPDDPSPPPRGRPLKKRRAASMTPSRPSRPRDATDRIKTALLPRGSGQACSVKLEEGISTSSTGAGSSGGDSGCGRISGGASNGGVMQERKETAVTMGSKADPQRCGDTSPCESVASPSVLSAGSEEEVDIVPREDMPRSRRHQSIGRGLQSGHDSRSQSLSPEDEHLPPAEDRRSRTGNVVNPTKEACDSGTGREDHRCSPCPEGSVSDGSAFSSAAPPYPKEGSHSAAGRLAKDEGREQIAARGDDGSVPVSSRGSTSEGRMDAQAEVRPWRARDQGRQAEEQSRWMRLRFDSTDGRRPPSPTDDPEGPWQSVRNANRGDGSGRGGRCAPRPVGSSRTWEPIVRRSEMDHHVRSPIRWNGGYRYGHDPGLMTASSSREPGALSGLPLPPKELLRILRPNDCDAVHAMVECSRGRDTPSLGRARLQQSGAFHGTDEDERRRCRTGSYRLHPLSTGQPTGYSNTDTNTYVNHSGTPTMTHGQEGVLEYRRNDDVSRGGVVYRGPREFLIQRGEEEGEAGRRPRFLAEARQSWQLGSGTQRDTVADIPARDVEIARKAEANVSPLNQAIEEKDVHEVDAAGLPCKRVWMEGAAGDYDYGRSPAGNDREITTSNHHQHWQQRYDPRSRETDRDFGEGAQDGRDSDGGRRRYRDPYRMNDGGDGDARRMPAAILHRDRFVLVGSEQCFTTNGSPRGERENHRESHGANYAGGYGDDGSATANSGRQRRQHEDDEGFGLRKAETSPNENVNDSWGGDRARVSRDDDFEPSRTSSRENTTTVAAEAMEADSDCLGAMNDGDDATDTKDQVLNKTEKHCSSSASFLRDKKSGSNEAKHMNDVATSCCGSDGSDRKPQAKDKVAASSEAATSKHERVESDTGSAEIVGDGNNNDATAPKPVPSCVHDRSKVLDGSAGDEGDKFCLLAGGKTVAANGGSSTIDLANIAKGLHHDDGVVRSVQLSPVHRVSSSTCGSTMNITRNNSNGIINRGNGYCEQHCRNIRVDHGVFPQKRRREVVGGRNDGESQMQKYHRRNYYHPYSGGRFTPPPLPPQGQERVGMRLPPLAPACASGIAPVNSPRIGPREEPGTEPHPAGEPLEQYHSHEHGQNGYTSWFGRFSPEEETPHSVEAGIMSQRQGQRPHRNSTAARCGSQVDGTGTTPTLSWSLAGGTGPARDSGRDTSDISYRHLHSGSNEGERSLSTDLSSSVVRSGGRAETAIVPGRRAGDGGNVSAGHTPASWMAATDQVFRVAAVEQPDAIRVPGGVGRARQNQMTFAPNHARASGGGGSGHDCGNKPRTWEPDRRGGTDWGGRHQRWGDLRARGMTGGLVDRQEGLR